MTTYTYTEMKTKPDGFERFDLEQAILECWDIAKDLEVMAKTTDCNEDVRKRLEALSTVYHMRFEHCFHIFEELIHARKL